MSIFYEISTPIISEKYPSMPFESLYSTLCHLAGAYQPPKSEEEVLSKLDSMDKEIVECEEDIKNLGKIEVNNIIIIIVIFT